MKTSFLNRVTSLPLFSKVSSAYLKAEPALRIALTKGSRGSACRRFPGLVSCFGWEGDRDAPIAYVDGSYSLRGRKNLLVCFGFNKLEGKIDWYNAEGFLPCFVSEYKSGAFKVKIENFADRAEIDGNAFVVAYSRVSATNVSAAAAALPALPKAVTVLTDTGSTLAPGETSVRTCCIAADRFGKEYPYPQSQQLKALGSFEEHYEHMKAYWLERLEPLVQLEIPDEKLMNAYRAGYIYTMIVKDGFELHVGENGYDRVFDHDVIGIISALLAQGDTKYFDEYQKTILMNIQYPDARWKYAWVFAQYLFKTGDAAFVRSCFEDIREKAHSVVPDREASGIMQVSCAIDSNSHWLIDNWSALTGLASYRYICKALGETAEEKFAEETYLSLLDAANRKIEETQQRCGIDYLPISMDEPNETCPRSDPRDANWASMFLFGRWAWDCFLLCAPQHGAMLEQLDRTYRHGFTRRSEIDSTGFNFGGYPHGWFCSAYNAGYGSAALRGDEMRTLGIRAYRYMIDYAMSGPFSWWEGVGCPDENSPWSTPHAASGGGSCPHMWGQATATKVLLDSLLSVRFDRTVIIGRGAPEEWFAPGNTVSVRNYLAFDKKKICYIIVSSENKIEITLDKSQAQFAARIELPVLKGKKFTCTGATADGDALTVDESTEKVTVNFE